MHPKSANRMAVPGLVSRNDLVGTGRTISVLFGLNGVRNKRSPLHFQGSRPIFSYGRLAFLDIC